jgi:hypothetical protein
MVGQAEIIVRAHVEHPFPAGDLDIRILWAGYDALRFVEALRFYLGQHVAEVIFEFGEHDSTLCAKRPSRKEDVDVVMAFIG